MSNVELAKPFVQATITVLSAMCSITPQAGRPYIKKDTQLSGDISVFVTVSGTKSGIILLSFPKKCALAIVKNMLGDAIEDIISDTKDAIGEVANIISGQARAGLEEIGMPLVGSTPSIIYGKTTNIQPIEAPTIVIPFTTEYSEFTLEFCIA